MNYHIGGSVLGEKRVRCVEDIFNLNKLKILLGAHSGEFVLEDCGKR